MVYVTNFFLVFAGMIVGYFLWYRDRSDEEAIRVTLTDENEDLRASLRLAHNSYEKLDERFSRQRGQLNVLQQLCDDWASSRDQAERERAQLEAELSEKTKRVDEAVAELQTEKERRIELEDKHHETTQQQIEKLSVAEDEWRQKHAKIESSLFQNQADLKSACSEKERLAKQLHASESQIAELKSELASQQNLLATASKNASGLKQEYVSVESALRESSELLKQSRSECASALSAQKVAEESIAEMAKAHTEMQAEIEALHVKVADMDSLEAQVVSLQEALENSTQQVNNVSLQRNEAINAHKSLIARAGGLQQRLENQEQTIHKLREKHEVALQRSQAELKNREAVEAKLDELTKEMDGTKTELQGNVAKETQKRLALETKVSELHKELTVANAEVDLATGELGKLRERESAFMSKVEELRQTSLRISELESLVQRRDKEDEQVNNELRTIREQYAAAYERQQELQTQLELATSARESLEAEFGQHGTEIRLLKMKLKASEETIRKLRRERAGVLARLANYRTIAEPDATVISFTEALALRDRRATEYDEEYGGRTSRHATRGVIYTEAPETKDDLKRISGIAEVLEARLNDYGIYTFKQIMEWELEAIEEFSRLLAFKDRIERDDWLGQARYFYREKTSGRQAAA